MKEKEKEEGRGERKRRKAKERREQEKEKKKDKRDPFDTELPFFHLIDFGTRNRVLWVLKEKNDK